LSTEPYDHALHAHGDTMGHGSRRGHRIGSLLAIILTVVPFWLVMSQQGPAPGWTAAVIFAFALVQIVVHMIYFLHMNSKSENGWTLMALIFTVIIVAICLAGSMWVMYHMNANMMPGMSGGDMGAM